MNTKFIHLLYVPTMACNMQCRYCYLEDNTVDTLKGEELRRDTALCYSKIQGSRCSTL